jgi:hypothetical protein
LSCTHAFLPTTRTATKLIARPTAALNMVQNRGLEVRRDTATPTGAFSLEIYCSEKDVLVCIVLDPLD